MRRLELVWSAGPDDVVVERGGVRPRLRVVMAASRTPPVCLSIAGSDSGGGAGIQADLKAFAACGVHGATALTALTAQSTVAVEAVMAVPGDFIRAQVAAVVGDMGVDAVKVGMLGDAETVAAVAAALAELGPDVPVVVDPVMVAESGGRLLGASAERALAEQVLPLATVVTPNLQEARVLAGVAGAELVDVGAPEEAERLARAIHALGPGAVLVTGGHREVAEDVLFDGREVHRIPGPRHPGGAAHGSGCTHSSALAAGLARGLGLLEAATLARAVAAEAVRQGLRDVGAGAGPVDVLGVVARAPEQAAGWTRADA